MEDVNTEITGTRAASEAQYMRAIGNYLSQNNMPHEAKFLQVLALKMEASLQSDAVADNPPCPECGGHYPMHSMECATGQARAVISVAKGPADTRADFEAHFALCSRQAWQHRDGSYKDPLVQASWLGWQAAKGEAK